jgi:hypothetical protein
MVAVKKLSTGDDSTLGSYLDLCTMVFGAESKPVRFIEAKMAESPLGAAEPVLADESQMVALLVALWENGT